MTTALQQYQDMYRQASGLSDVRFVTVYQIERCYGGPEEGGWWYDWYTPVQTIQHPNGESAADFAAWLRDEISENGWNDTPLESCAGFERLGTDDSDDSGDEAIPPGFSGDARHYFVTVESVYGENASTERPHYE